MKILITGGLGFIGSNFTKYYLGKYKDDEVVVVDKCTYASNNSLLKEFKNFKNFTFYKADIIDLNELEKIFKKEKFDYCVNLAAETSIDKSFLDPALIYATNVIGLMNLVTLVKKYGVSKFHQVSTYQVYGENKSNAYFKETDEFNPSNPYSLSKAHAEEYLKMYSKVYDIDYTVSRICTCFGSYQAHDKLIPLVIYRAKFNQEVPVYGDGTNMRDWIYVSDACRAIDLILKKGKKGEAYNVSSHEEHSALEITKLLVKKMRKPSKLITFVEDRKINEKRFAIDTTKIESELGFRFEYDFEYALDLTLDYYLGR